MLAPVFPAKYQYVEDEVDVFGCYRSMTELVSKFRLMLLNHEVTTGSEKCLGWRRQGGGIEALFLIIRPESLAEQ